MTNKKIEPALTPEEWSSVEKSDQAVIARTLEPLSRGAFFRRIQVWTPEAIQVMALANVGLPDDDPRKITYADVDDARQAYHDLVVLARWAQDSGDEALRQRVKALAARMMGLADKIESLLPPDVTTYTPIDEGSAG